MEANKKFQQINEANEVLSDPEKRKKYDQYGKDWQHAKQFEQARHGGARQQQQSRREYAQGDTGEYDFSDGFGGTGFSDFFASMFGQDAGAQSNRRQAMFRGRITRRKLHLNLRDAYTTHKQTLTVDGKNIRITVPAGIENGQKIKLAGYGSPSVNSGPNGDLFITFVIADDSRYKRKGNDLYVNRRN